MPNATIVYTYSTLLNFNVSNMCSMLLYNNKLYLCGQNNANGTYDGTIHEFNPGNNTSTIIATNLTGFPPYSKSRCMAIYGNTLYSLNGNGLYKYVIGNTSSELVYQSSVINSMALGSSFTDMVLVYPYIYAVGVYYNGIARIHISDSTDVQPIWCSTVQYQYRITYFNGYLYTGFNCKDPIYKININSADFVVNFLNSVVDSASVYYNNYSIGFLICNAGSIYISIGADGSVGSTTPSRIDRYSVYDNTSKTLAYSSESGSSPSTYTLYYSRWGCIYNNTMYIYNRYGRVLTLTLAAQVTSPYTVPLNFTIDVANTFTVNSGNLQVTLYDTTNISTNNVYYLYSYNDIATNVKNNTYFSKVKNNGPTNQRPFFYISGLTNIKYTINVFAQNDAGNSSIQSFQANVYIKPLGLNIVSAQSNGNGNIIITFNEIVTPPYYYYLNNVTYWYYLYSSSAQTNQSGNINAYINTNLVMDVSYATRTFNLYNKPSNSYTVYFIAKNSFGNSTITSTTVIIYSTPIPPIINTANTVSTSSGNLTVSINDSLNSNVNGIYYWYSINGITYGNSNVLKTGNTASFTISDTGNAQLPLTENTYTLYVSAVNSIGNAISTPATVIVIELPQSISIMANTKCTTNGNLTVYIRDTFNQKLNNISYWYYLYDSNSGEQNYYGNIFNYNYSETKMINGITDYSFVISGLYNTKYTLYVITKNTYGNSNPSSLSNVMVYTVPTYPPQLDVYNTRSTTSGNLNVCFNDTSNNYNNNISYLYYIYDPSYGVNNFANVYAYTYTNKTLLSGITQYSFSIYGYINKVYIIYFISQNTVGYSINSTPISVTIYTYPNQPTSFDILNTTYVQNSSGNLKVSFIDINNSALNQVYYWYSIDNGITYSNTFIKHIDEISSYTFYVYPLNNILSNIIVCATNTVGSSLPISGTFTVLQTPLTPNITTRLVQSGNVLINVSENIPLPENYVLNNVSYYYYLYNQVGENLCNNIQSYTNFIGYFTESNNTLMTYIDNLQNSTSTFYVVSKNDVGYSNIVSSNITIYTTPVNDFMFDQINSAVVSPNNLQISIIDQNYITNGIQYLYSIDGNNYTLANTRYVSLYNYQFNISNLSNGYYTIYVISQNTVGVSSPKSITKNVYGLPEAPVLDQANTFAFGSGNLFITFTDLVNNPDIFITYEYYLYNSTDDKYILFQ